MTQLTPNLQLKEYDRVADKTQLFIDYRDDQSGTGSTSNMSKIDAFAGKIENNVTDLKGTGWTNQTVKGNYDLITQVNGRVTYTVPVTGTNTLVGTISQITGAPANNSILKIYPSVANTNLVTLSINGETAKPIVKVQNWTGSTVYASLEAGDLTPNQPTFITKSSDGTRYFYIGLENYAKNIYFENGVNDYTNLQDKLKTLDNGVPITSTLNFGTNTITKTGLETTPLNTTFTPKHYVNLLGRDGNCEDISKWRAFPSNLSADTANKVFGSQSVKAIGTAINTAILLYRDQPFYLTKDKYYMASAYVKTGVPIGAIFLVGISADNGAGGGSTTVTQNTVHTRVAFKFMATRDNSTPLYISAIGRENPTAISDVSMDGVMITEITATEYTNDTVDTLMARYPYADSLAVTKNLYLKSAHADGSSEECVIEGDWFTGDTLELKDGQVIGSKLWKYKTLFGKDYAWEFLADGSGNRIFRIQMQDILQDEVSAICIKYDGKPLASVNGVPNADQFRFYTNGIFDIRVSDADSGFTETLDPNGDELKALANGWKALDNNGVRYDTFVHVDKVATWTTDITALPENTATTLTIATTATNIITVANANIFKIGDLLAVGGHTTRNAITGISGNQITLTGNVGAGAPIGRTVFRQDKSGDTRLVNYCKANVAPNFEGWKLAYKLATPQPINEDSDSYLAPVKGTVPVLKQGENTVTFDTGVVLGEVATPTLATTIYFINDKNITSSRLRNKAQRIIAVRKNGNIDLSFTIETHVDAYGLQRAYCQQANFDPTATYTVDYEILDELAPQIGTAEASYSEGLVDSVNGLYGIVGTKQNQSVSLDNYISLAMYEKTIPNSRLMSMWYVNGATLYVRSVIGVVKKLSKTPILNQDTLNIYKGNGITDVTSLFVLDGRVYNDNQVIVTYRTTDATTITDIKANGVIVNGSITVDCRGVI